MTSCGGHLIAGNRLRDDALNRQVRETIRDQVLGAGPEVCRICSELRGAYMTKLTTRLQILPKTLHGAGECLH